MKIFIDSADLNEIKQAAEFGIVDGVTTNPSLIAKSGANLKDVLREIADLIPGPISGEVVSTTCQGMLDEAAVLKEVHDNIVIKLPLTEEGIKACKKLTDQGIKTNVTLCFQPTQALLAAKAGATYISPFIGRLDDIGTDGIDLISQIRTIYDNYGFETEILAASIRHYQHVRDVAMAGADVATIPFKVFQQLFKHPLTDKGLDAFLKDWEKTGQTIK